MTRAYLGFGLTMLSELPVPGALPWDATPDVEPDLIITLRSVPPFPTDTPLPYALDDDGLHFHCPGIASFLCGHGGRTITVSPLSGITPEQCALYLIATAIPAALWMRRVMVLHAAAALLPVIGGGIAFAGPSGSGKTSMLHSLIESGTSVIAEDAMAIRWEGSQPKASGLPACLFLRDPGTALHADRHVQRLAPAQCRAQAPLRGIVILKYEKEQGDGTLRRLRGQEPLEQLLRHRHRPKIPRLLGLEGNSFIGLSALANTLPVYVWPVAGSLSPGDARLLQEAVRSQFQNA